MQIYIAEGTQQTGPFDLDTIKNGLSTGKYTPTQLAWYEGAPGWEPISKLPGMETVAAPPPTTAAPPSPYSPAPSPGSYSPSPGAYSPAPSSSPGSYSPAPSPYTPAPSSPPGAYPPAPGAYSPNPSAPPSPYSPSPGSPYSPPPSFVPPTPTYGPGSGIPKKGFWAKVGTVLLGLLAVLAGIARVARPFTHHSSYSSSSSSSYSSTPSYTSNTPTPTPTIRTTSYFNNANQFTSGERQKYYVNFNFDFPSNWEKASGTSTKSAADFVELRRVYQGLNVESFSVEDFYTSGASLAADLPTLGAKFMASVDSNARQGTVSHQKISDGPTKFRGYTAYEYRCKSVNKNNQGQNYTLFTRYVIVAPASGKNGVILEMFATNSSPDVHGIDDLGVRGEMAVITNSFSFRQ